MKQKIEPTAVATPATPFPKQFRAAQFAHELGVSKRWVEEHSRAGRDPLPHFRRGRVRLYSFSFAFIAWWQRQIVNGEIA